ncbi:hypothetical protein [Methanoregula sp.]|uniref:hypothetical protein n=1 Tax=Methanoregula sp. TaxID=2052170 RepID=UPI002B9EB75C|nr:hypothetical protein [Methanoregula sp.]HVP97009.1 hypothetical protein [Methanoregula sp.]
MEEPSLDYAHADANPGKPESLVVQVLDNLALIWSIGIGIGYAFLVAFVCWIGYRCFLIYHAYVNGDMVFIIEEMRIDLLITAVYFGVAAILRRKGII